MSAEGRNPPGLLLPRRREGTNVRSSITSRWPLERRKRTSHLQKPQQEAVRAPARRRLGGGELLHLLVFTSICSSVPPHIDAGQYRPPPTPPDQNMSD